MPSDAGTYVQPAAAHVPNTGALQLSGALCVHPGVARQAVRLLCRLMLPQVPAAAAPHDACLYAQPDTSSHLFGCACICIASQKTGRQLGSSLNCEARTRCEDRAAPTVQVGGTRSGTHIGVCFGYKEHRADGNGDDNDHRESPCGQGAVRLVDENVQRLQRRVWFPNPSRPGLLTQALGPVLLDLRRGPLLRKPRGSIVPAVRPLRSPREHPR